MCLRCPSSSGSWGGGALREHCPPWGGGGWWGIPLDFFFFNYIFCSPELWLPANSETTTYGRKVWVGERREMRKQAEAELCQAHEKLG